MGRPVIALDSGSRVSPATLAATPLAANITSTAVTVLVGQEVAGLQNKHSEQREIEVAELTNPDQDRVVVVPVPEVRP